MKFKKFIEVIQKNHKICLLSSGREEEILDVRMLDPQAERLSPDTLYFSYDTQAGILPANCVLIAEDPAAPMSAASPEGNLAVISPSSFGAVFNEAQDLLRSNSQDGFYHYLMETADRVRSVDTLIDIASQSFGASLILIDRNFRILSHSTQIPVTDHLWIRNIQRGYCDYEFIMEVRKLKAVQMADSSPNPIEVTCTSSPYRKLASRVICRDTWIGSLILIEGDDSYRAAHSDMLRTLSGVLGYSILRDSPEFLFRMDEYHDFLNNLLIGAPFDSQPAAWRKLPFPGKMQLAFFQASRNPSLFPGESVLASRLSHICPSGHIIATRSHATLIAGASDLSDINAYLSLFPEETAVQAGISRPFSDIRSLQDARREAEDALQTGIRLHPDRRAFSFEDYSTFVLLQNAKNHDDIRRYLHPAIAILQHYDAENDTHLLETLRIFLRNNANIKDTSEALYLHRNSVAYRLRKIEELTGLRPEDGETAFRLRLSFAILQAL